MKGRGGTLALLELFSSPPSLRGEFKHCNGTLLRHSGGACEYLTAITEEETNQTPTRLLLHGRLGRRRYGHRHQQRYYPVING